MIVVVFRSRLTPKPATIMDDMAAEMSRTAKEMPGFVEFKSFKADDGERVSLVYWQDHETMAAWRNHPRHRIAQRAADRNGTNPTASKSPTSCVKTGLSGSYLSAC